MQRIILHVDLDYFYAQVEEKKDSSLKHKPIVVCQYSGRTKDSGAVATTNYIARKFNVRSGLPIIVAKKLLEGQESSFIAADHELYEIISNDVMAILRRHSDIFEKVSIDEAFLDISSLVSGSYDEAETIATGIKDDLRRTQGLTCSIGIGPNKLITKIASDFRKPDGITIVKPGDVKKFLLPLEVGKLYGVGVKTKARLGQMGIRTVEQLANYDPSKIIDEFGTKFGTYLHLSAHGEDNDPVEEKRMQEQIGRIATLKENTRDMEVISNVLAELAADVHSQIVDKGLKFKAVSIMAIMEDLSTKSKTRTLDAITDSLDSMKNNANQLFRALLDKERKDVRRVGIKVSNLSELTGQATLTDFKN